MTITFYAEIINSVVKIKLKKEQKVIAIVLILILLAAFLLKSGLFLKNTGNESSSNASVTNDRTFDNSQTYQVYWPTQKKYTEFFNVEGKTDKYMLGQVSLDPAPTSERGIVEKINGQWTYIAALAQQVPCSDLSKRFGITGDDMKQLHIKVYNGNYCY